MTSSLAVPRLNPSLGGKKPNLPVIEHPMSRLGNREELSVQGSARLDMKREKAFALSPTRSARFRDGPMVPPNSARKSAPERILQWPPEHVVGPNKQKLKRSETTFSFSSQKPTEEVHERIKERITTGFHGLKHLFKANDPAGKGTVSREALLRILYSLVGYISQDQYSKFLRKNNFDNKDHISFDEFVSCFKENETVQKEWISPTQRLDIEEASKRKGLEDTLKHKDMLVYDPYISAPYADKIFKEKVTTVEEAKKVFPVACFEKDGMVVPPQLREAYAQLGIFLRDRDFNTLWTRYDKDGLGAIRTHVFFKRVGIEGRPMTYTPRTKTSPFVKPRPKSERVQQGTVIPQANVVDFYSLQTKEHSNSEQRSSEITFEESYNALMAACELFDYLGDEYISRVDFRRVLQEFGFNISMTNLDGFLSKNGGRSIQGQLNYKEFLQKFQSKSENSLTNKVMTNKAHLFQNGLSWPMPSGAMTPEELEARLIDLLHGDFIKLITFFKSCDKYNLGVITQQEFRSAIDKRLGYPMSEKQWEQLKYDVGTDRDGLIPYTKFLQLFDITPGSWNRKEEGGLQVYQIVPSEMPQPPPVEKLKEKAKTYMQPQEEKKKKDDGQKTVAEIQKQLEDLFKNKIHVFDKHFREMDRKSVGRMSKWQFGALLRLCGLSLPQFDLERIWATLNVGNDGMYSYSSLIRQFVKFKELPEQTNATSSSIEKANAQAKPLTEEKKVEAQPVHPQQAAPQQAPPQQAPPQPALKAATTMSVTAIAQGEGPAKASPPVTASTIRSSRIKELLIKVKSQVISNWEGLKSIFKYLDRNGTATITIGEMMDIMKTMNFDLTESEVRELCERFDLYRNGRFHYLEFMRCYSQRTPSGNSMARSKTMGYNKYSHKLEQKSISGESDFTVHTPPSEIARSHSFARSYKSFRHRPVQRAHSIGTPRASSRQHSFMSWPLPKIK
ncbi:hypothetical protein FSP39_002809 [Pinctada imbricata]|uniref:EF-hand domain-containing protein n=1 Tax=Pinctada imbricata TaxID=66713 RepID=A0AA88YH26_PINIB|nr:hypothetical protein FSP39_002809 [Pinctada imbricata]